FFMCITLNSFLLELDTPVYFELINLNDKLTASVKELAHNLGADLVGVAQADSFVKAPKGYHPEDLLQGAQSVIVMAMHLLDASFESAPSREYAITYYVANQELDRIAFHVSKFLQNEGYRALQVPASPPYDWNCNMGDLSHRHAGQLAGIGVFGKNSLLLSTKFGSRMRLVSVITDVSLKPDKPLSLDLCKDCDKCLRACPVGALKGERIVDKTKCDTHHVEVGKKLQLGDLDICGVCIRVCPVGKTS
ncbi:MAG: 4Fe-4S binding protein, partial [Candidatus Bathyarchaeota archaeon]|nr:4Fe-4S binding protein [Candidatus Bathyarchaeota archaeon]